MKQSLDKNLFWDMEFVKDELRIIRNELKEKVGRDEFKFLETRVVRLEKAVSVQDL